MQRVIGVAGAGVMGVGVARNLAQTGHGVVLVDLSKEILDGALATIERDARMSRLLGGPAVDVDVVLAAITPTTDLDGLAEVDVVIENIPEDWRLKRELYARLDTVCGRDTVFVANTSAIPITRIGAATKRPDRVIGVHFMNPVPMKPAVELIPGFHTSPETVERTKALLGAMGKKAIEVRDSCGFISNRLSHVFMNEAAYLVYEGVADAETVDEVFRGCFGHPMGPLETADLIGVDTVLQSIEVIHEHYADGKYRPCPLLKQMTDAGLTGRKSGRGFHGYDDFGRRISRPATPAPNN